MGLGDCFSIAQGIASITSVISKCHFSCGSSLAEVSETSNSLLPLGAPVRSSVQSGGRFSLGTGIRARLRGRKLDTFRMDLSALSAKRRGLCLPNNRHVYIPLPYLYLLNLSSLRFMYVLPPIPAPPRYGTPK